MGNITQLKNPTVFRFELYNLAYLVPVEGKKAGVYGHYTFWYHLPTRKYVFCKHGDYANLVSFHPVHEQPRFPDAEEASFCDSLVSSTVRHAYFYDGSASCNKGAYLLPSLEKAVVRREGWSTEWFKHRDNEHFGHIMKTNAIFPDFFEEDYKADAEYWKQLRENDSLAIKLLTT